MGSRQLKDWRTLRQAMQLYAPYWRDLLICVENAGQSAGFHS